MTNNKNNMNLGAMLRQQRLVISLTLHELAAASGVSSSHLCRIEKGERFPSASVLRSIAKPLGFEEGELFSLAGYLSPHSPPIGEKSTDYSVRQLDPYVARVLAQEPIQVQRTVIGILSILRSIAKETGSHDKKRGTTMIKAAVRFQNDMVMVFDKNGEQISEYQDQYQEVKESILEEAPPNAIFAHGLTDDGELQRVPREEW